MRIVEGNEINSRAVITGSVIGLVLLLALGSAIYFGVLRQEATDTELQDGTGPTQEIKDQYKQHGIDIEDHQAMERLKQQNDQRLKGMGSEDIGRVVPGTIQERRYGRTDLEQDIQEAAQSVRTSHEPAPQDQTQEQVDTGPVHEDLRDTDRLIAASVLEIRRTMGIIRESLDHSLHQNSDPYNSALLQQVLERSSTGQGLNEHSGIDDLTYGDFFDIVKYWLFYYVPEEFSWKIIDRAPGLYNEILLQGLYDLDFETVIDPVLQIVSDGTRIDQEYVDFVMIFHDGERTYRGSFTIQDNMPRLLDLEVL